MSLSHPGSNYSNSSCEGSEVSLDQFRWENRILVIFAEDSAGNTYQAQIDKLTSQNDGVLERDLVIFSIFNKECSTLGNQNIFDSSAQNIRRKLSPTGPYSIYLIGKDGGIKLKKDKILDVEELFRVIDRMPMRQREMRDGG